MHPTPAVASRSAALGADHTQPDAPGSHHTRNASNSVTSFSPSFGSLRSVYLPSPDVHPISMNTHLLSSFVLPLASGPLTPEPIAPTLEPGGPPAYVFASSKLMDDFPPSRTERLRLSLHDQIETKHAAPFLLSYLALSGFIDSISFTACFIFCGFQTGNTVQLALALARLVSGPDRGSDLQIGAQQALVSLLAFLAGSLISRIVFDSTLSSLHRFSPRSRGWMAFSTLLQAVLTALAVICSEKSHQSGIANIHKMSGNAMATGVVMKVQISWTGGYGLTALTLLSASMGLQGSTATPIGAHLANTLAVTSIWIQLVTEPHLMRRRAHDLRDHRIMGLLLFFLSAFLGRVCANEIGPSWSIGIAAFFRLFLAVGWMVLPLPKEAREKQQRRDKRRERDRRRGSATSTNMVGP